MNVALFASLACWITLTNAVSTEHPDWFQLRADKIVALAQQSHSTWIEVQGSRRSWHAKETTKSIRKMIAACNTPTQE